MIVLSELVCANCQLHLPCNRENDSCLVLKGGSNRDSTAKEELWSSRLRYKQQAAYKAALFHVVLVWCRQESTAQHTGIA